MQAVGYGSEGDYDMAVSQAKRVTASVQGELENLHEQIMKLSVLTGRLEEQLHPLLMPLPQIADDLRRLELRDKYINHDGQSEAGLPIASTLVQLVRDVTQNVRHVQKSLESISHRLEV